MFVYEFIVSVCFYYVRVHIVKGKLGAYYENHEGSACYLESYQCQISIIFLLIF